RRVAAAQPEAVALVAESAVARRAVPDAAEREAVASVRDRLAAGDRVASAVETHAVGGVVRRAHARDARDLTARRRDAHVEPAHGARPDDREPPGAAGEDLDARSPAGADDRVAPEAERRGATRGHVDEEAGAGTDARRDRVVVTERARSDEDVAAVARN